MLFDIWTMSMEEWLELLPELLALADMSSAPSTEAKGEAELVEVCEGEEEGFGACSG